MATIIHKGVKAFACIFAGIAVCIGTVALPPVTLGADAQSQRLLPHQFTRGEGFVGVWWGEVDAVLAGIPFPFIITYHADGTFIERNAVDELSERPFSLTPMQGVWKKTGRSSARSVGLRFVKDPATGNVTGFERVRTTVQLEDDDHITGTFSIEVFECVKETPASPPHCPNPTDDITGFFPPIVQNVPYTATRVKPLKPADNDDGD